MFAHNSKIEHVINKTKVLEKYKLTEKEEEYEQKEIEFQTKIIDEERKKFYGKQYKYKISSEELIKIIADVKKLDRDNVELIKEIEKITKEKEQENIKTIKENIFTKIKRKILGK